MQKISIVGAPGAGKSTFARALGAKLGRDVLHLDFLFWSPDICELSRDVREGELNRVLGQQSYILEGGYPWTYRRRIADCDTLIWLDTPPHHRFANMLRRNWSGRERIGMHPLTAETRKRLPKLHSIVAIARQQHLDAWHLEPVFAAPPPGRRLIRLRGLLAAQAFLDRLGREGDAGADGARSDPA